MKNRWLFLGLAMLAIWSVWLTIEVRKLGNVRREIAELQRVGSNATSQVNRAGWQATEADWNRVSSQLESLAGALRASNAASLLRRAERPATQAELNSLASRIDILEGAVRASRTAGR
jgi:hypothetical protein